jgi:hypothetical protein
MADLSGICADAVEVQQHDQGGEALIERLMIVVPGAHPTPSNQWADQPTD